MPAVQGRWLRSVQRLGMDGNSRFRNGASECSRGSRRRQRTLHRLGVRHGARAHRAAEVRHSRHSHTIRFGPSLSRTGGAMNASYEWLKAFTDFDLTPQQLRDVLTSRAATVDELVALRADLADVVVGLVVEAKPHPNSDHLWVTRVDAGASELLDVVCGAPNVQAGSKYPFAPSGATLPGGLKLERRKIRGETSNGMLCSARELGLGTEHDGILVLHTEAAPGTPFLAAYPAGDTRLVIDVLPNRPDLLSHEGVAREISAFTGNDLHMPGHANMNLALPFAHANGDGATGGVRIVVEDLEACPLYAATVIRGVRITPSPGWLAERIVSIGLRPINNVVDATNYMLHGFGQPMHAFDLDRLQGPEIRVRKAHAGERIRTLDGVERKLDASMLVIADANNAQAVAGVIGGDESAVHDATTNILLEVAVFAPRAVRSTRREHSHLEQYVGRRVVHSTLITANHTGDSLRIIRVGDNEHRCIQLAFHTIECPDAFTGVRFAYANLGTLQSIQVERVHRLTETMEHVIGRINNIVDWTQTDADDSFGEPPGARRDSDTADDSGRVQRARFQILHDDPHPTCGAITIGMRKRQREIHVRVPRHVQIVASERGDFASDPFV